MFIGIHRNRSCVFHHLCKREQSPNVQQFFIVYLKHSTPNSLFPKKASSPVYNCIQILFMFLPALSKCNFTIKMVHQHRLSAQNDQRSITLAVNMRNTEELIRAVFASKESITWLSNEISSSRLFVKDTWPIEYSGQRSRMQKKLSKTIIRAQPGQIRIHEVSSTQVLLLR